MIKISARGATRITADDLLTSKATQRDDESHVAATLQSTLGDSDGAAPVSVRTATPRLTIRKGADSQLDLIADEIARTLEVQLSGRIRDLSVVVEDGQFVLRGQSRSYHVKQIAQHVAMTAMDTRLLGRLVNEIVVHAGR